jgi:hypothetical protein
MEMDFLDISSLRAAYRYIVKIEQKFKKWSKWEFRFENNHNRSMTKEILTHRMKNRSTRKANPKRDNPRRR